MFNTSRIINFSGCNKQCMGSGCPVCGNDQTTYQSLCDFQNAACTNPNLVLDHGGPCGDVEMGRLKERERERLRQREREIERERQRERQTERETERKRYI